MSAHVRPARPRAPSTAPTTSSPWAACSSQVSGTSRTARTTTTTASGTLIRKTHRHDAASTSQPPSNGPAAPAIPVRPDQAPIARARSARTNTACSVARLAGVSRAPPMPCSARAAISVPTSGARPHSSEATANQTAPTTKMRRRPYRSASDPPSRISAASVRTYALTVHCSPARSASRSAPMLGRATLTAVASRKDMPEPSTIASSTRRPTASPYRTPVTVLATRTSSPIGCEGLASHP